MSDLIDTNSNLNILDSHDHEDQSNSISLPINYENMPSSRGEAETESNSNESHLSKIFKNLLLACRAGDIETVDSLLTTPNLNINQVDEWDYSPLILASLCGHTKIVELLLSRGAICDRDTFQGARCIYGALNDTIRDILISFDISKAVDASQPFAGHISSLLNPLFQIPTKDIAFYFPHINGTLTRDLQVFRLNRFLLSARSPYFKKKLNGPWKSRSVIEMPNSSNPVIFKVIVDYMYLRTDILPLDQKDIQPELIKYGSKLGLHDLLEGIELINKCVNKKDISRVKHDVSFRILEKAREDLQKFLQNDIFHNKQVSKLELSEKVDLEDIDSSEYLKESQKIKLFESESIPDIIISVLDIETESAHYYPVHKSIISRSDYFDTMLKSDIFLYSHKDLPIYKESKTLYSEIINYPFMLPDNLAVIQMTSSSSNYKVTEIILSFLYHDDVSEIPLDLVLELLFAADELFLDRLKTLCAVRITSFFNKYTFKELKLLSKYLGYNVYEIITISWQTRCDKLEQHMSKLIAYNLCNIYYDTTEKTLLLDLIRESALRITDRQDTDTIELIDDIRYYLSKKYGVYDESQDFDDIGEQFQELDIRSVETDDIKILKSSILQYERDIEMIDNLLYELELDA